jgi:hypothetical protein
MKKITYYRGDIVEYHQFKRELGSLFGAMSNSRLAMACKALELDETAPTRAKRIDACTAVLRELWRNHYTETTRANAEALAAAMDDDQADVLAVAEKAPLKTKLALNELLEINNISF